MTEECFRIFEGFIFGQGDDNNRALFFWSQGRQRGFWSLLSIQDYHAQKIWGSSHGNQCSSSSSPDRHYITAIDDLQYVPIVSFSSSAHYTHIIPVSLSISLASHLYDYNKSTGFMASMEFSAPSNQCRHLLHCRFASSSLNQCTVSLKSFVAPLSYDPFISGISHGQFRSSASPLAHHIFTLR